MEDDRARQRRRPTADEVISKLKDDGDFDSLRLKIIRKVKENEELRNNIIQEVKESEILNQDGSENLKPRQLSDAIYQELGKKIMGQISDEVWKVIRNEETKDDIRGTVESVYNRIVNPKLKEDDIHTSPIKDGTSKQNGISTTPLPSEEANMGNGNEPKMSPGSASSDHHEQHPNLLPEGERHHPTSRVDEEAMPPGFDMTGNNVGTANVDIDIDDAPPGFETGGTAKVGDDDDDDLDAPPGFG